MGGRSNREPTAKLAAADVEVNSAGLRRLPVPHAGARRVEGVASSQADRIRGPIETAYRATSLTRSERVFVVDDDAVRGALDRGAAAAGVA